MSNLVEVIDKGSHKHFVFAPNGILLGISYPECDGYYVFLSEDRQGFWSAHILRWIAERLDELNAEWDLQVKTYMNNESLQGNTQES